MDRAGLMPPDIARHVPPLEAFRPVDLRRPAERAPAISEGTPEQMELARVLQDAYVKSQDSLDPNIRAEAHNAPVELHDLSDDVKIDPVAKTISYKGGPAFGLPKGLSVGDDGKTIRYIPSRLGTPPGVSPSSLAAATSPKTNNGLTPIYHRNAAPKLTPEQLKQQAQELANQQAAAARAAQEAKAAAQAAKQAAEMKTVVQKKTSTKKAASTGKQETKTSNATLEQAAAIIGSDKAAKDAINYARNAQQTTAVHEREVTTAVAQGAQRGVAAVKATEGAEADARQQQQKDRGQAEFSKQADEQISKVQNTGKAGIYKQKK